MMLRGCWIRIGLIRGCSIAAVAKRFDDSSAGIAAVAAKFLMLALLKTRRTQRIRLRSRI
jgi:hypothetical protein